MTTFEEKAHWAAEYLREALKIMLEMPNEFRDKTIEDNIRRAMNRILNKQYYINDELYGHVKYQEWLTSPSSKAVYLGDYEE